MEQYISMGFDPAEVHKAVNNFKTHDAILSYLVSTKSQLVEAHILGPLERRRAERHPVALQNVGNTCYLNSLLQSYYMLPAFYKLIMDIIPINEIIKHFQEIFASLTGSICQYANPSPLFLDISKDQYGNYDIEQKDIGEFNLRLIERLENAYERPQSNLEVNRSSIFFMLFYGETIQYLKYIQNGETVADIKTSVTSQLLIDVSKDNELYAACESEFNSTIDNYSTPEGDKVTACMSSFFESLPKILIFQLNRAVYDKNTQTLNKNHDLFKFPKEFYPARFLHENREISSKIYTDSISLELEIRSRQKKLEELKNFAKTQDLLSSIRIVSEFVSSNEDFMDRSERETVSQALNNLEEKVRLQIETLENELQTLKDQKENLYNLPELTSLKYYLHSIMVHEGSSEIGHYYCYIFDYFHKKWRVYNDINVKEVSEEEVFYKSFGGTGNASAYCIMYADISMIEEQGNLPLREFTLGFKEDLYSEWVPQSLRDYVTKLNKEEIESYDEAYYSMIQNEYERRYNQVSSFLSSKTYLDHRSDQTRHYWAINSYVFLISIDERFMANWHLLDVVIQNCTENKYKLENLGTANPKLYQSLSRGVGNLPNNLVLNQQMQEKLRNSLRRYKNAYEMLNLMNYIYEHTADLELVLKGLVYIMSQMNSEANLTTFKVVPMFQICLLRMISQVLEELKVCNFDTALGLLDYIYFGAQSFLEERGPFQNHVLGLIRQICEGCIQKDMLGPEQLNKLNEFQSSLNNNDLSFFPDLQIQDTQFTDLVEHLGKFDFYSWSDFQDSERHIVHHSEQNKHLHRAWGSWVVKYERLKGMSYPATLAEFMNA